MKVLQLHYKMPFPIHDGGAYSIYSSSLAMLNNGLDVKVFAMNPARSRGSESLIPDGFSNRTRFESVMVDNRVKPVQAFLNIFRNESYFVRRFSSKEFDQRLKSILAEEEFDIIVLEHLYLGHYLKTIRECSKAKVILRAQNVENMVWYDYVKRCMNPFLKIYLKLCCDRLTRFEEHVSREVDGIIALSQPDAAYFSRVTRKREIVVIPVGVLPHLPGGKRMKELDQKTPMIYHLGSMDWRPNEQGMKWFVRNILPLAIKRMPGIRIHIAGRNMPRWFFRHQGKNLFVKGTVEDSGKFMCDKTILMVPLLSGSGIRVKIIEAMAAGKTIISTSVGALGIPADKDSGILIADTAEEFAELICRCAGSPDLCSEMGRKAIRSANRYEISHTGKLMEEFFLSLMK